MRIRRVQRKASGLDLIFMLLLCGIGVPFVLRANGAPAENARRPSLRVLTRVPFQASGSSMSLKVMVNGQGPFPFGWDTGASQAAWVTRALVEELHLPVIEGYRVSDGTGVNSRNADGVRIDTLRLGDVSFHQVLAPVLGDGPKNDGDGEAYGTLGFEMFKDYVVTYDYPGKELRIATGHLPKPDGKTILNYILDRGSPRVLIQIGGLSLNAWIDTGNPGTIHLPLSLADKLSLRTPLRHDGRIASTLNEVDLYRSELSGDVHIGKATIHDPDLMFSELVRDANLGRGALRGFAITFDERHRRLWLQPSSRQNER